MGFFDGFFGLTNNGRTQQNLMNGLNQDFVRQMQQWLQQGQTFGNNANGLFDWARAYWGDQANNGAPSIGQIRGNGEAIMPYGDILGRLWGRQQNINDYWQNNVSRPWEVTQNLQNHLNLQTQNVNNNNDYISGQINDTFNGMSQRETDATNDIRNRIDGSYNQARDIIAGGYGNARNANRDTYNDILGRTGNAFQQMRTSLEQLRPGGALQQAQVARSFAPNVANAMGRLRRAGVDPNSVQAANVIGNVEMDRARAMDDRAAATTRDFVQSSNALRAGELDATTNALTRRLNNDISLGTTEAGMQGNLALGRGQMTNSEVIRNLMAMNGIDGGRFNANISNSQNTTNSLNDILRQSSNLELLSRQMQLQDFNQEAQNQRDMMGLDRDELNLRDQQWQRGSQWANWDQGSRNQAAQALMQLMQGQYGNMFNSNAAAQGWGGNAYNQAAQQYQQELARSGWGTRLLGGLAGSALSGFLGGGGFGGMFGRGAARTPGFNVSSSWMTGSPAIFGTGQNGFNLFNNPFGGMNRIGRNP